MKADKKTLEHLNKLLLNELTGINQYVLHSRMFKHWGLEKIADVVFKESIDEMKHADKLVERIFFLGGLPNLQDIGKLLIGQELKECLECDLKLEEEAVKDLKAAIVHCESQHDFVTSDMLKEILANEDSHIDWIETQIELIDSLGVENYKQSQV